MMLFFNDTAVSDFIGKSTTINYGKMPRNHQNIYVHTPLHYLILYHNPLLVDRFVEQFISRLVDNLRHI